MGRPVAGKEPTLTVRQKRFVHEYILQPNNAKLAAIRAGYAPKCAASQACDLLARPYIKRAVEEGMKEDTEAMGITRERVLQELALIAFANLKDIVSQNEDGDTTVDLASLSKGNTAALTELNVTTTKGKTTVKSVKVKLADKIAALERIGKHLGMFKEQVDVNHTLSLQQLVESSFVEEPSKLPSNIIEGEVIPNDSAQG